MAVVVLVEEKNKRRDLKDFELIKARSEGFKEHLIQIWGFRIRYVACDSKRVKNLKDAVMKSEDGGSKDDNDAEKHIDAHLLKLFAVEDIHGLMCMVKKTPKASLMVVYYAKLTKFYGFDDHLYHAYAWFKLFSLQKSFNKNLSQKDLQLIASSVVLAALSVAPYDNTRGASHLELEHEKEQNLRMANLIGFIIDPKLESREVLSRSSLLTELVLLGFSVLVGASAWVNLLVRLKYHF
ncbi:Eukaryotic translation initiation factor 3 subunit A [Camellia lanceoleosa]|uniref:Eukaryotic translation initiation factor 3 subunit A n=1 Tax=Camellia lanceoleosa TaxID=1840588 RepID=A0ACC0IS74_9ERIC|nr:Eukaryotic translation initiation factor 3 subunit A [Camellia lanceoleosa]